jgi:hypothetical protein
MITTLLKEKTPFAVIQYYESFKASKKETKKKYELIYLSKTNELTFLILKPKEVSYIKSLPKEIKLIIKNKDGKVYEYNNFKDFKEKYCID